MPQVKNPCLGKVSLQDLSDSSSGNISPVKLEKFLRNVVDLSVEKHGIRPDALVKVVYDGELLVLTQEQADHLLQDPVYRNEILDDLRIAVERALKGDAACVRQELMVMIMMARMTLDQFRRNANINQIEIVRQYPILERTEKEADRIVKEIELMSSRIDRVRSQHPIIAEYETKIGQMVAMQQSADLLGAKQIAKELRSKKKHYLFCCRAIEPDIKGIQFRRLDLQRIKRRVLSIHQYLLEQKVEHVQIEMDTLQGRIKLHNSGQDIESIGSMSFEKTADPLLDLERLLQSLQNRNASTIPVDAFAKNGPVAYGSESVGPKTVMNLLLRENIDQGKPGAQRIGMVTLNRRRA